MVKLEILAPQLLDRLEPLLRRLLQPVSGVRRVRCVERLEDHHPTFHGDP
jgi:hypothetical protein